MPPKKTMLRPKGAAAKKASLPPDPRASRGVKNWKEAASWLRARGIEPKLEPSLASGSFEAQAAALDRFPDDTTVAIFGHEPWVSELLGRLVGTRDSDRLTFKKGGAALVEVPDGFADGGTLVWYLTPKLLRKLG